MSTLDKPVALETGLLKVKSTVRRKATSFILLQYVVQAFVKSTVIGLSISTFYFRLSILDVPIASDLMLIGLNTLYSI